MPTLLLIDDPRDEAPLIVATRARLRDQLASRWDGSTLDRLLAAGCSPDASPRLALRARVLLRLKTRRRLSLSIQRILREGRQPRLRRDQALRLCRQKVVGVAPELERLAHRLASTDPVDIRGVAMVEALITDGSGALYCNPSEDDLAPMVALALDALEPRL